MKVKLSELEPGQAFKWRGGIFLVLSNKDPLIYLGAKRPDSVVCLVLKPEITPKWHLTSFSPHDTVELYEGEE